MSERTINRINEIIVLALFLLPLARWCIYAKDGQTALILAGMWLILPLSLYLLVDMGNNSKYKISKLSLYLFLFTCSLLFILMSHYGFYRGVVEKINELANGSDFMVNILYFGMLLIVAYLFVYPIVGGFIFVVKLPEESDEEIIEPKNYNSLSPEGQQLMVLLQDYSDLTNEGKLDKSPMLKAVTLVVRDFLDDFMKMQGRQAIGDEIISLDYLKNYIPSTKQIKTFPKASLELMLSSSEFIENNFVENPYFNFKMINGICLSTVEERINLLKAKKTD